MASIEVPSLVMTTILPRERTRCPALWTIELPSPASSFNPAASLRGELRHSFRSRGTAEHLTLDFSNSLVLIQNLAHPSSMTSQESLEDIFAIRWPRPGLPEDEQAPVAARHAALDARGKSQAAFFEKLRAAEKEHGPDHDPLLVALEELAEIKRVADEQMRLLLAYGRVYVTPRPHTLETLGQAVGLTPSGVSRAFGAKEVLAVGSLTGQRPTAVEIRDHDPEFFTGDASRRRCTWGGSKDNPCTDEPKYAVTDKSGTKWACCDRHLPGYLRSRPRT
ncbi:hypothetical protein [Streptomyces sp. NPDC096324]|uniref:hypothetical protein n=1 Tax=Streptomyces sp. NPDC096324 TaxID=3366085 RepID=UPI00382BF6ED